MTEHMVYEFGLDSVLSFLRFSNKQLENPIFILQDLFSEHFQVKWEVWSRKANAYINSSLIGTKS
jgi:hypothetical protein